MQDRPFAAAITDIKEDLKIFLQTRAELFRAEAKEKLSAWKRDLVLLAVGVVFLVTSWVTFVFAAVALIRALIAGYGYPWFLGGIIVGVALLLVGGACAGMGYQGIKASGLIPGRTLRVLRHDQEWIRKQARPA